VPQAVERNMVRVDLRQAFSEGPSEPDTHIVESQDYLLDIGGHAREGLLVDFLLNLPVVTIPHASTKITDLIVRNSVPQVRRAAK